MENYDASKVELKWQEAWEKNSIYAFDPKSSKPVFSIDTPPPTVSGNMHIGHAFSYAQQDFIARYKRMAGFNVYYPFGTDDNGLPTERLVEKLKKVKSTRMTRPEFVNLCRQTISEIKPDFISDWKRIGMSCDFSRTYSTIDKHSVKTSQKSFLDLYQKGLVYKKNSPSMWCVSCQTAIAQAELEDKEFSSTFNDVRFDLSDGNGEIIIATTRPELMPACVAIFVSPKDERYKHLIGKEAIVPIFGQRVPIIEDESADMTKGSGAMMICTYGDKYDVEAIKRKNLNARVTITKDGKLNELGAEFKGLSIKDARIAILKSLEEKGYLKLKKNISHAVNVHDKCGTEIEFLETEQWFVKVIDHKEKLLEAGNQITWYPPSMKSRYDNWVKNLGWDWCISRQRHFGVPFPVWYTQDGKVILANEEELPVDPISQKPKGFENIELIPEKDVMDTWATSSVSPQIVTNWIKTKEMTDAGINHDLYPMSLRPQAHDIIRTWAFYTIAKGIYHENQIPWKEIIISGNVADPKGEKMSKSKGNVINPRDTIAKYSSDALRYWAATSKLGEDLAYQEKDLVTGKKTSTKLWNAANFCFQHLQDFDHTKPTPYDELEIFDQWLLVELSKCATLSSENFEEYNFSDSKRIIDQFFWHTLCDNYLEIVKARLYSEQNSDQAKKLKKSAQTTLYKAFLGVLKMMAPIMPFITEELYEQHYKSKEGIESIHITNWPKSEQTDEKIEQIGNLALNIIGQVRKYKAERQLSLKQELKLIEVTTNLDLNLSSESLNGLIQDLISTTKAEKIVFLKGEEKIIIS